MNTGPIERLTSTDLINLYVETPSAPARVGALAILDGRALLGSGGQLRIADLRDEIDRRLRRVSRLRQIVHRAGPLAGRPVWVDDPAFHIDRHVHEVALPAGEALTELAMRLVMQPFDWLHPLWRIWFVAGLPEGRVALIFGMHHAVADGATTVHLIGALMDSAETSAGAGPPWSVRQPPAWRALFRDNLRGKASGVRGLRLPGLAQWRRALATAGHAPRTSLNPSVGPHRRLDAVTVDLAAARDAAHRHGGHVNDVVLALAAGGIRQLLLARSEPVDGVRLHVNVAVAFRGTGAQPDAGNRSGGITVRVPLDADPYRRLRDIARESAEAKGRQPPTISNGLVIGLSRLGLLRYFSHHQHMINFMESNVAGPRAVLHLLGAPILDIIPIGYLAGNLSLGFLALSYAGQLTIAVQADADRYPDLPVLVAAMRRESRELLDAPGDHPATGPFAPTLTPGSEQDWS